MVIARAATLPKSLGRTFLRRVGSNTRNRSWKQIGRRTYASDHGHGQQQSSEIPWIIGSAAVTIPAAGWLIQQGPTKSDHGHDAHHDEAEKEAGEENEEEEPKEEEPKDEDESKEESKDEDKDESKVEDNDEGNDESKEEDKDDGKNEGKEKKESGDDQAEEGKSDDSSKEKGGDDKPDRPMSEDGYELPGPNAPKQINWNSSSSKGPGEGQKGDRKASEKKGEKDSQGGHSGAKHPYLDDPEKSKKGVGVTETAKIHGTVDPSGGARGAKQSGDSSS